tara:strand:+ start:711 stop:1829 length:1119 start_codon:yes stop_codon:yes gene_type:complete
MSQIHVNKNNEQLGPFSVDEVNKKLASGEFATSNKGWMKGMSDWKPLSDSAFFTEGVRVPASDDGPPEISEADKLKQRGKEAVSGAVDGANKMVANIKSAKDVRDFLPYLKLVDGFLRLIKNLVNFKVLDQCDEAARKIGFLASAGGALVMLAVGIILSIKVKEAEPALFSLLILPGVALAQYIALKFLGAGRTLIEKSPGEISSQAFLECLGLILTLLAIGFFCLGVYISIESSEFLPIASGLGVALIFLYSAGAALNLESVNITLKDDTSIGDEAIGLFAFCMKLFMRLVPFTFGVIAGVAFVLMSYSLIRLIGADGFEQFYYQNAIWKSFFCMLGVMLLPFLAYVGFVFSYMTIDLWRATLCLFKLKEK